MNPFPFRSNNHFVSSSDGTILQVYELTKSINHLHTIHKSDWKKLAIIIHTSLEEDDDDEEMSFNGLLFFDGHGRIEGKKALPMLAKHLKELHLLVSPEGYCFQQAFDLGSYFDFGIYYLRLNDLFSWPHHGVDIAKTNVWRRSELRYQYLPRRKNNTSKWPAGCGGGKEKYAELERIVKEKDEELEKLKVLKNNRDDAEGEKKKMIEELEKVENEKKELEKCRKKSWAILPSTKFLTQSLDAKDKYLAQRQQVPLEILVCRKRTHATTFVSNSHKLVDKMKVDGDYGVRFVDEKSNSKQWIPPPTIKVYIGQGDVDFDKNNWWYLKTTHPEGGLTMLVYYEGSRSQISHDDYRDIDTIIPLPFTKGILEVYTYTHTFSLFRLEPFGVRFGFAYRPK
ncbi:hypothetical protein LINGRAHAP2_LOCUS8304 [Linum grandiflorum]